VFYLPNVSLANESGRDVTKRYSHYSSGQSVIPEDLVQGKTVCTVADMRSVHPGFPSFHPVAWCHYYDGGRAWITTLGHDVSATSDLSILPTSSTVPGRTELQKLLVNGVKSAMGLIPFCT
jgi:hypothetical protein